MPPSTLMSKQTRWLFAELERWTKEQIISNEQAVRIRTLYTESASKSWGLIIFSGLGAAVIGLGVILLLAYNWDDIPKAGKLGLVFVSVIAAHAGGLWLRWKTSNPQPDLGEALSVLGTMLFGAGIWLVAQVYNIDEHFPNGFLIWGLGALLLGWALESVAQALIATVLLTIWGCTELFSFDTPADWAALIVLLGIAPLAWRRHSAVLTTVVLAAVYLLLATAGSYWNGSGGAFTIIFSLSALLIGTCRLEPDGGRWPQLYRVMGFFGWCGFLVCSYILSFKDAVGDLLRWKTDHLYTPSVLWIYRWPLFIAALLVWGRVLWKRWSARSVTVATEEWLCPIALVYCQGLAFVGFYGDAQFIAVIFNFVCLGIAVMWMMRGCRDSLLRSTVLGSVLFAALVFARYFDLFESLAMRGVVFLIVGGVLFAEGFFYRRLRQSGSNEGSGK